MKRTFTLCHAIDNDPTKKKIISQSNQDRPRDSSINMILSYSKSLNLISVVAKLKIGARRDKN